MARRGTGVKAGSISFLKLSTGRHAGEPARDPTADALGRLPPGASVGWAGAPTAPLGPIPLAHLRAAAGI